MLSSAGGTGNVLLPHSTVAECVSKEAVLVSEDRRPRWGPLPQCSDGVEVPGAETIGEDHSPSLVEEG